jgi:hypothetical protein
MMQRASLVEEAEHLDATNRSIQVNHRRIRRHMLEYEKENLTAEVSMMRRRGLPTS